MANPGAKSGAGITIETIRTASNFEPPIIFLYALTGDVCLVNPEQTLDMTAIPVLPYGWNMARHPQESD
ncbi:MAG: hypothetical protein GWQ05_28120 [Verrucomicrobiaceae bacterium]|nr:hypothetical protein [Verrucomicrobiaceae bacterium]NCF94794.1 hypothetical protein [Verrucomicrobiaceae bacterium]